MYFIRKTKNEKTRFNKNSYINEISGFRRWLISWFGEQQTIWLNIKQLENYAENNLKILKMIRK